MEPSDFDKILRGKVLEDHGLHDKELEAAKPFVWSAVYNKIGRKKTLTWYHLVAAVVILLISFSIVLVNIQKGHQQEMAILSGKIDQLEKSFTSQTNLLQTKDSQLSKMKNKLESVVARFTNLDQQSHLLQKEVIVYRTDTVFVKQKEYLTVQQDTNSVDKTIATVTQQVETQAKLVQLKNTEIDDIIYPSGSFQNENVKTESLKVQLGAFAANKN